MTSYYTIRGCYSSDGIICGTFSVLARYTASSTGWYGGAALSFILHIMLNVVADLIVVFTVENLIFILEF